MYSSHVFTSTILIYSIEYCFSVSTLSHLLLYSVNKERQKRFNYFHIQIYCRYYSKVADNIISPSQINKTIESDECGIDDIFNGEIFFFFYKKPFLPIFFYKKPHKIS